VILGQIIEKSNRRRIGTMLHIVLKFQLDGVCFHRGEASANFGVSNYMSESPTHTQLCCFVDNVFHSVTASVECF